MLSDYVFIGLFTIIAVIFPFAGFAVSYLVRPKRPDSVKEDVYECGVKPIGEAWVQFKVQYYLYALVFVIFDVISVFLFPWAVAYHALGFYALVEMTIFLGILAGGLIYAWRKGALRWI